MITYDIEWVNGNVILPMHAQLPIRQVYVWVREQHDSVIIVSKDGAQWQLPGGKPEAHETPIQTAIREVYEETGIDAHDEQDKLQLFGYRIVTENDDDGVAAKYLQLRYRIQLDSLGQRLTTEQEDGRQPADDAIKFVERVSVDEACQRMSWLRQSEEYRAFRAL